MKIVKNAIKVMEKGYVCDRCLGRIAGQLLSGMTNKERGKILRFVVAMLLDSGENLKIESSNFEGIKFRNKHNEGGEKKDSVCWVCNNFFIKELPRLLKRVFKKVSKYEFKTYLVGTILSDDLAKRQEKLFELVGAEWVENIKNEINREVGKSIEKKFGGKLDRKNPDITVIMNLKTGGIRLQVKSLYIYGEYQKLVRGIPQATWYCPYCHGKGCPYCHGTGLLYPTSIQMIIEKPLLKATKAKKSKIHAAGREDIDARCLAWRPFVLELVKPKKRKVDLKKIQEKINKSKKVKVRKLKIIRNGKEMIKKIKSAKNDKTYRVIVEFEKPLDKEKLKNLKALKNSLIMQRTPLRVIHRRSDRLRKRKVKNISWKIISKNKLELKIRAEAGLYIKELITGDEGRTEPNVAEILENKPKKILLDVIKIWKG